MGEEGDPKSVDFPVIVPTSAYGSYLLSLVTYLKPIVRQPPAVYVAQPTSTSLGVPYVVPLYGPKDLARARFRPGQLTGLRLLFSWPQFSATPFGLVAATQL